MIRGIAMACIKTCLILVRGKLTTLYFRAMSWAGGGPKRVPVLHVAALGLHTHRDSTNGEVGLDVWVWVSLQGLHNINDICVAKGRSTWLASGLGLQNREAGSTEC